MVVSPTATSAVEGTAAAVPTAVSPQAADSDAAEARAAWAQVGEGIDGEADEGLSGWSVALSADGSRVAVGAPGSSGNDRGSGHVRVFDWDGGPWVQVGVDIDGEASGDNSGYSVALSADGSRVAIGAIYNDGGAGYGSEAGHVRVFDWDGEAWVQVGVDIDGEGFGDASGTSVALSADGSRVAVGAPGHDSNGENSGQVRVFDWDGVSWVQAGADIEGKRFGDSLGWLRSVALSADGSRLAIGAPTSEDPNDDESGYVQVFDWDGGAWVQAGDDIEGEAAGDTAGPVVLSADGSRVAIGASFNSESGELSGHVRVFDWDGSAWAQVGADIDGEAAGDRSGWSVALSAEGSRIAIGAPFNDGSGELSGHVRVFDLDGAWVQVDADIDGQAAGSIAGTSVAMSGDGSRVAIGSALTLRTGQPGFEPEPVRVFTNEPSS